MTETDPSPEQLAREILAENDDISPLLDDVVDHIQKLRVCGLPDAQIKKTVPGMYRIKQTVAEEGGMNEPAPEEIRVISLPQRFQREDWA